MELRWPLLALLTVFGRPPCSRANSQQCAFEDLFVRPLRLIAGELGDLGYDVQERLDPGRLQIPRGIALDATWVYVADSANHAVRRVRLDGGPLEIVAGVLGEAGTSGERSRAWAAKLRNPYGVALDTTTQLLYIADYGNHAVRYVDLGGTILGFGPEGDPIIDTLAGTLGVAGSSGDGGSAKEARLHLPASVACDSIGRKVYIAEYGNHVVRLVDLVSGRISTLVGALGSPGSAGDGGLAIAAQLRYPMAVALGGDGTAAAAELYVADYGNHAVRRVDLSSAIISTVAGTLGVSGKEGDGTKDGGPATSAWLNLPGDIVYDHAALRLYIAGLANPALRSVDLSTGKITSVIARAGHYGGKKRVLGDGGPVSLAMDSTQRRLYMSEGYNHAIRYADLTATVWPAGCGPA